MPKLCAISWRSDKEIRRICIKRRICKWQIIYSLHNGSFTPFKCLPHPPPWEKGTVETKSRIAVPLGDIIFKKCVGNTGTIEYERPRARSAHCNGIANINFSKQKVPLFECCDFYYRLNNRSQRTIFFLEEKRKVGFRHYFWLDRQPGSCLSNIFLLLWTSRFL